MHYQSASSDSKRAMNTGSHVNHEEFLSKAPEIGGVLFIENSSREELNERFILKFFC
jgi:hypothetical protein